MVQIAAFRALRPTKEKAKDIASLPYDVVDTGEAREVAKDNPLSFLRVVRSELELPEGSDPYADAVYDRARDNLDKLEREGHMQREDVPCLYLYRLNIKGHRQTGLVALASVDDYEAGRIKKHELTRPDKERDRTEHMDRIGAHTGPVFLLFRSEAAAKTVEKMDAFADENEPLYDITFDDGVRHRLYRVPPETSEGFVSSFAGLDSLYIADGHHRSASSINVALRRRERGDRSADRFLTVSFPDSQLRILPYNRAVVDLAGRTAESFLETLREHFELSEGKRAPAQREFAMYLGDKWFHLRARPSTYEGKSETETLDVSILQNSILSPLLNVDDPRTSDRIKFVGGIRGDGELERLVNGGKFAVAFAMHPTGVDQLLAISDANKIMPPKSTWFEPKLRSGFLVNLIGR